MPVYAYEVYDADGNRLRGSLTADTAASGRHALRTQGMRVADFQPVEFKAKTPGAFRASRNKKREQTCEFARQLSMLLTSGVPLAEALDVLIRQHGGKLVAILRDVRDRVAGGSSLSDALAAHPTWFDDIFCSAVKVGQMTGQMDASLRELASHIRENQTIKTRLFTALAYPAILAILGTAVVIFLMSYVVPQLLAILETSGRSLPTATVLLKMVSDFLVGHWLIVLGSVLATVLAGIAFYSWTTGRRLCHELGLRVPLLGVLIRKAIIAQFAQTMSLLLHSGVSFVESLRLIRDNSRHLVLARELEQMESAIRRGSDIAPTLQHSKIFPPLVVHIVNVGQKAGELTEMLVQLKDGYETEMRLAIAKFTAILEPVLIVTMSAVVGFVVFATLMPILEVTRAIQ